MSRTHRSSAIVAGTTLTALIATGCPSTDDAVPTETERASMPVKYATFADGIRPEVGYVGWGSSGCTGTLIDPRWVLTAGHCLDWFRSGKSPGAQFVVLPESPQKKSFPVHRGFNLGTLDVGGASDLALLELAEEVPYDVATPTPVAYRGPVAPELVTSFGFGCSGWRGFRAWQFSSGLFSELVTCPGDSGGPLFLGGVRDGGYIARTSSRAFPLIWCRNTSSRRSAPTLAVHRASWPVRRGWFRSQPAVTG